MATKKRYVGLWLKEGQYGKYMSGRSKDPIVIPAETWINVQKNKNKKEDKHPDYQLVFDEPVDETAEKAQGSDGATEPKAQDDLPF